MAIANPNSAVPVSINVVGRVITFLLSSEAQSAARGRTAAPAPPSATPGALPSPAMNSRRRIRDLPR
jgi:hypothetical protein